ncbi:MAG: phosphoglycerate dehydrogenase [Planctomycetota bacterium]
MTEPPADRSRVLICDDLNPAAVEVFRRRGLEPEVRVGMTEGDLMQAVRGVHAVVVRSASRITRNVLEAANELIVVGRAGIGVDNIDCEAATERGIVVMNTPRGNALTTAELTLAHLFALARHVPQADRRVRAGQWKKTGLVGTEIAGKTLGVIGLGRIGRLVAERARGLGMRVVAFDPYLDGENEAPVAGVELSGLDQVLSRADFLTVHVPLTETTRHLLGREEFAKLKPGARLIQCSRGGIVDEAAVLEALDSGQLAGAAFDVFEEEPPRADHPLLGRDEVIVTPHLGASSEEAQLRVAVDIAEQVSDFLLDGHAQNAVNAPTLAPEAMSKMGPYLLLAEKMGSFLAQRMEAPIKKLELCVTGEVRKYGVEHLRLAMLVGLLRDSLSTGVNFVSAPTLARERGILVLESTEEGGEYSHGELRVTASERAGGETHSLVGTVFGRQPRFVEIDQVHLDLAPKGTLLITEHRDQPGVVGAIGSLLGAQGVNIKRLELAPHPDHEGKALGFFQVDALELGDWYEELLGLAAVETARWIRM